MAESDGKERERSFTALPKPDAAETEAAPERRRGWFDLPDGALGIFVLLILAAVSGGLIAVYWPWLQGNADTSAANDRLTALESRVGQIAAGQAPKAAAASYEDMRRDVTALKDRIDADEARLMALEKSTGAAEGTDVASLKAAVDKNTSDLQQFQARMAKLETASPMARLDAANKSIADLKKDLDARAQSLNDALARLEARTGALEKTAPPADLADRLDSFALKSDEAGLDARIAKLEAKDVTGALHRAAALLAVTGLARATQGDRPFTDEFAAVRALLPGEPEVTALSAYAGKGVPTRAMLRDALEAEAGTILAAAREAAAKTWWQRLWANLAGLVTVRRVGDVGGDTAEAHVARAEDALKSDDLPRAVAEISALKGPAADAARGWLKDAKARQAVDGAVAGLSGRVVLMLAEPMPDAGSHP